MSESDQQQQQNGGLDLNSNIFNQNVKYDDNIRYFTETQPTIREIEMRLKGYYINDKGEWVFGGKEFALMNNEGCREITTWLHGIINTINLQGAISEVTAKQRCKSIRKHLVKLLYLNFYKWELKKERLTTIRQMIDTNIFMFMTRPIEDRERKRWDNKAYTHTESIIREETPKKKNIFPFGIGGQA